MYVVTMINKITGLTIAPTAIDGKRVLRFKTPEAAADHITEWANRTGNGLSRSGNTLSVVTVSGFKTEFIPRSEYANDVARVIQEIEK